MPVTEVLHDTGWALLLSVGTGETVPLVPEGLAKLKETGVEVVDFVA